MRAADIIAKNGIIVLSRVWFDDRSTDDDYAPDDNIEAGVIVRVDRCRLAVLWPDGVLRAGASWAEMMGGRAPAIYASRDNHPSHPELPGA